MIAITKIPPKQTEVGIEQSENELQSGKEPATKNNHRVAFNNKILVLPEQASTRESNRFQDYVLQYSALKNKKLLYKMSGEQTNDYLEKLKTQKTEIDRLICPTLF